MEKKKNFLTKKDSKIKRWLIIINMQVGKLKRKVKIKYKRKKNGNSKCCRKSEEENKINRKRIAAKWQTMTDWQLKKKKKWYGTQGQN